MESDREAVRIGVVTPVLNGEEFLRQTLESIWSQASDDVRIDHVLVDGGSTDRTMEIAADFPTRILRSEDDQGMYDAVNKGMAEVDGAIVGYINADDELAPGAIAAIVDSFRREPKAGWLCGRVEYTGPDGEVLGRMQPVRVSLASYAGIGWSTIPQQTVWARREFFDAIGPFDLDYRNCGDYDWYARALRRQHPLIVHRTLGRFRLHPAQISLDPATMERESRMVQERYGGTGRLRWLQGKLLSLRLNARNPAWLVAKKRGRISFTADPAQRDLPT